MSHDPRVDQVIDEHFDSRSTPEEACRSCPELLPEVRRRWRQMCGVDADVQALFPTPPDHDEETPPPWQDATLLPQIPGYTPEFLLGRGGMGVVFRARHLRLNRTIALKMMLAGAYAGPRERERFLREAEAVASLRHPNVVQVYDVGDHEGRPFFTMEFVEGGSLAHRLTGVPQPARQAAQLLATLAEAVESAHQGGIVHRDLKPANILLTADGTPKVSDFGLARRLDGEPGLTRTGTVVGTPSYMAPEQVQGRSDELGPATDTYALGAIFYELLTGRPPFRAETAAETLRQVVSREPVSPSRLNAAVPRDAETICLKCLEKNSARRYSSAAALAEDLRRFQRDEPIVARPVGPVERALRWARRKPTTAALVATALALVGLTIGGGLLLERQQAARQGRAQEAVEAALAQVPSLRQQGRWAEALALLTHVRSRLDEAGSDDLARRLTRTEADLELAAALEQIRLAPLIVGQRTFNYTAMAEAYAQTFAHAGLDIQGDEETLVARVRDSDVRPQLVMALDHWAYLADTLANPPLMARLLHLAQRADPDPYWGDRFRNPALWRDQKALRGLAAEAEQQLTEEALGKEPPTPLVALLASKLREQDGQAEALLRAAQWRHPDDFWLNYALGEALRDRKSAEAVSFYRAALVTRPAVATVYHKLCQALLLQARVDEAMRAQRKVVELVPRLPMAHSQLGICFQAKGQLDEAMAAYRHALDLDPRDSASHYQIGVCLRDRGQRDEAIAEFQRAIQLNPNEGAMAYTMLGACLQDVGRFDDAISEYRRALELNPKLPHPHHNIGMCLQARGRLDDAVAEFRRAVELTPDWGQGQEGLTNALLQSGRLAEAHTAIRRGLEVLAIEEPKRQVLREKLQLWERLVTLDARLPAILERKEQPAAAELLELARLCRDCGWPHAAADLAALAFAASPALADDLKAANRYNAACCAARAAAGVGRDVARLGEPERADLRRQALAWLHADLALRTRLQQGGKSADWALKIWQTDHALSSVRDPAALATLPADERASWQRLWADVAALRTADPLGQGRTHAAHQQWAPAAVCYARVLKGRPTEDGEGWFDYAALLLLSGDRPGYAEACARMVECCGKAVNLRTYHVARACTLSPGAVPDPLVPARLAEAELKAAAGQFWSLTEQGALHCRVGRFKQAVALFEQSLRAEPKLGRTVLNWLWLALANQHLGKPEEARRWLDKATAWLDQYRDGILARAEEELGLDLNNWLEAQVLRREAEAMIRPADPR
ncbi:MAG TPA: tetratricopeptide repeat protein [Pirellulales bacterium]|nr:tetratricopeptide repeat protein [Pirellulales bacterium]